MPPKRLSDIIPSTTKRYALRSANNVPLVRVNSNYFMHIFFSSTIAEWNKIDPSIRSLASLNILNDKLLQFVELLENSLYTCHNPIEVKYIKRLRLGFSQLRYHKFKHDFLDAIDPFCSCCTEIENTENTDQLLTKTKSKLLKCSFIIIQFVLPSILM